MKITVKVKPRAHRALFDDNLPFKGRREEPRTTYKRHSKHKGRDNGNHS